MSEYPQFEKGEQIEVKFCGVLVKGTFIEWKPKEDRPFGYWLCIRQTKNNYFENLNYRLDRYQISPEEYSIYLQDYSKNLSRMLNDQFIISINGKQFNCHPQ
jgi:hypothetical protein